MNTNAEPLETDEVPEQVRVRKDKRERLLDDGGEAYPVVLAITSSIAEVREKYSHLETGE
ncbi:MAG: lysine--tRNA ligase, partial [Schaalia hyovaginalis]|nr:lysine--tRNA ligase [Schaalia hyovaginalis]